MGQNQDKPEGEEQILGEGLEETSLYPDSRGTGSLIGDVIKGGSSCKEETGNTREPDIQDLNESPCQEAATFSNEKHIHLWMSSYAAREVRQGGTAGKEGGEGGRAAPLVPQETDTNQTCGARTEERSRAYKLGSQVKRRDRMAEEELHTSSSIKMESHDERTVPRGDAQEDISPKTYGHDTCEHVKSLDDNENDSAMMRINECAAHPGQREFVSVRIQNESIMAEVENEDIKLSAGTVGSLSKRKEPPPAQPQHPLKNSPQKGSLLDMSDTIHYQPEKERTEANTKEDMCDVKLALNECSSEKAKVTEADIQRESVRPTNLQMDAGEATTHQETDSVSKSTPVLPTEASSILEKLLKRNRKEANLDSSKMKDVNIKEDTDDSVELNSLSAVKDPSEGLDPSDCAIKGIVPSSVNSKANSATEVHYTEDMHMKQTDATSDGLCFKPGIAQRESTSLISTDVSVKDKMEVKQNICSSEILPSPLESAVSAGVSCEMGGVITEASASSSVSDTKAPPTKSHGENADLSQSVAAEKTDTGAVKSLLQIKNESDSKINLESSGSEEGTPSVNTKKVEDLTEDTVVDVAQGTVTEENHQVTTSTRQHVEMTLNTETATADPSDNKSGKERDDGVLKREKSQNAPKSRPVSDLIKETIQLHEKLQHQDRAKPAEVKIEEQSVKVAQMKAAFDTAQKSPDKAIERKPSVRKGKKSKINVECNVNCVETGGSAEHTGRLHIRYMDQ